MKYLAIDYGTKRIGLAVSHDWLAEPLEIVPRDKAAFRIAELVAELGIDALVLGISEGKMADDARSFGKELTDSISPTIPLIETDETLTSVETHLKLAQSSMPRSRRQEPIDHYAAAAILQDYLDVQPHDTEPQL